MIDPAVMGAVINNAGEDKEHCGEHAVTDHLINGTIDPLGRKCCNAQQHKTHVRNGLVSDHFFEITLP